MSRSQHDPLKDFLVDLFGSDKAKGQTGQPEKPAVGNYRPIALIPVFVATLIFAAPQVIEVADADGSGHAIATEGARFVDTIAGFRWVVLLAAFAFVLCDVVRYVSHRQRVGLDSQVRQATRHLPTKISVGFPPGIAAVRSAKIKLPRGAIIRPKELDELTSAVRASASRRSDKWTHLVTHEAHKDQIIITRKETEPDTRSARHKALEQALKDGPLKDPVVTVDCYDESGVEIGFKIAFTPSLSSGSHGFQKKVEEALASLAGGTRIRPYMGN